MHEGQQARALGAQRAAVDRVVRVGLDVDDAAPDVLGLVVQAVHQDAAAHRAIRAGIAGFSGAGQLEMKCRFSASAGVGEKLIATSVEPISPAPPVWKNCLRFMSMQILSVKSRQTFAPRSAIG